MSSAEPFYVTTPIYYVNDKPHVGHCYTTLLADAIARFMRAAGRDVFFLTGTDEHAEKVVESAAAHGVTPLEWADRNAAAYVEAFNSLGITNDDFIRTTEDRHKRKVIAYIEQMLEKGDIELGDYEGWWDASQEEYVTETVARDSDFASPVTGKPLVKRTEQNYFFRLDRYQDKLLAHIKANPDFIKPEARRNEVVARIKQGLQKVPVSRAVEHEDRGEGGELLGGWGIPMPGDPNHRIYVWIDALINYLSTVDTDDRRKYWPAQIHMVAKDILWFHAVIWPCMLMSLGRDLPGCVYAHSFWIREGRKMSKSLGNFLDMPTIDAYVREFGVDAWRWYMLTQGPAHATDADFVHARFVETYNADLANGIGNAFSRVSNMIGKYFDGECPDSGYSLSDATAQQLMHPDSDRIEDLVLGVELQVGVTKKAIENAAPQRAFAYAIVMSNKVDAYIHETQPFKLAKDESKMGEVGTILYNCAESLRIAAVLLSPALPNTMGELLRRMGQEAPNADGSFSQPMKELCAWGGLKPGTPIVKGEALFPRKDVDASAPEAVGVSG